LDAANNFFIINRGEAELSAHRLHLPERILASHYRNLKISRRPIALGVDSIAVGVVYAEGGVAPRRSSI
jgi:hypothetical protein